jgi:hypothetical protein
MEDWYETASEAPEAMDAGIESSSAAIFNVILFSKTKFFCGDLNSHTHTKTHENNNIMGKPWKDVVIALSGMYAGSTCVLTYMNPDMSVPDDPIQILLEQEKKTH